MSSHLPLLSLHSFEILLGAIQHKIIYSNIRIKNEDQNYDDQFFCLGCFSYVFVGNSIVDIFAKCGEIRYTQKILMKYLRKKGTSWTRMIYVYAKLGEDKKTGTI